MTRPEQLAVIVLLQEHWLAATELLRLRISRPGDPTPVGYPQQADAEARDTDTKGRPAA